MLVDAAVWAVVEDADDPTVAVAVAADDAATEVVDTAVDATEAVEVAAALEATVLVDVCVAGTHFAQPLLASLETYALSMQAVPVATGCHGPSTPAAVHITNPSAHGDTGCSCIMEG